MSATDRTVTVNLRFDIDRSSLQAAREAAAEVRKIQDGARGGSTHGGGGGGSSETARQTRIREFEAELKDREVMMRAGTRRTEQLQREQNRRTIDILKQEEREAVAAERTKALAARDTGREQVRVAREAAAAEREHETALRRTAMGYTHVLHGVMGVARGMAWMAAGREGAQELLEKLAMIEGAYYTLRGVGQIGRGLARVAPGYAAVIGSAGSQLLGVGATAALLSQMQEDVVDPRTRRGIPGSWGEEYSHSIERWQHEGGKGLFRHTNWAADLFGFDPWGTTAPKTRRIEQRQVELLQEDREKQIRDRAAAGRFGSQFQRDLSLSGLAGIGLSGIERDRAIAEARYGTARRYSQGTAAGTPERDATLKALGAADEQRTELGQRYLDDQMRTLAALQGQARALEDQVKQRERLLQGSASRLLDMNPEERAYLWGAFQKAQRGEAVTPGERRTLEQSGFEAGRELGGRAALAEVQRDPFARRIFEEMGTAEQADLASAREEAGRNLTEIQRVKGEAVAEMNKLGVRIGADATDKQLLDALKDAFTRMNDALTLRMATLAVNINANNELMLRNAANKAIGEGLLKGRPS